MQALIGMDISTMLSYMHHATSLASYTVEEYYHSLDTTVMI